MIDTQRPPFPPFSYADAITKVRTAEDAWNGRDPAAIAQAYTSDSQWRNRDEIFQGRTAIQGFLERKWMRELEYRLIKEIWVYNDNKIAVRFAYEWHDHAGRWYRSYGNENWAFAANGLMQTRHASINDKSISADERLLTWPDLGIRPADYPGLTDLGL